MAKRCSTGAARGADGVPDRSSPLPPAGAGLDAGSAQIARAFLTLNGCACHSTSTPAYWRFSTSAAARSGSSPGSSAYACAALAAGVHDARANAAMSRRRSSRKRTAVSTVAREAVKCRAMPSFKVTTVSSSRRNARLPPPSVSYVMPIAPWSVGQMSQ